MPASTLDPIGASLRATLAKPMTHSNTSVSNNGLESQLAGASKKALLAHIEFEPAGGYQTTVLDQLKTKYIVIKSSAETPQPSKPEGDVNSDEELKLSERELYPIDAVQLGWTKCDWTVGAGMINMGNTCYLNSTLQALFHVPAFVNWLMADKEHNMECQDPGGCIICAMRKTLQESQQRNATSIRPLSIYNKLRMVCRNLTAGRQEDAHEFLRYLVEAMEKSYLGRFKNHTEFDAKTKETTPLNQILGGYLRSAVRCLKCGQVSTTFQHFQDLLLDIRKAQTIEEALDGYFSRERLDDDSYQCQSCGKKVPATKQFSVERAPMVLCIQLKRFSVSNNKITKHIQFRQRLDLTRYARQRPSVPLIYRLVALVTHLGPTVSCGHYTAVAQAPTGNYYQFDDSMVRVISHQAVFSTNAYIMLYELESTPFKTTTSSTLTVTPMMKTIPHSVSNQVLNNNNNNSMNHNNNKNPLSNNIKSPLNNNNKSPLSSNKNGLNNNSKSPLNNNKSPLNNGKSPLNNNNSKTPLSNGKTALSNGKSPLNKPLNGMAGIGITSDVVYGPELPPDKLKLTNGNCLTNGTASKNYRKSPENSNEPPRKETAAVAAITNGMSTTTVIETVQKIVPYDIDDSSGSDELNNNNNQTMSATAATPHAENGRILKLSGGEWKVTQTDDSLMPCKMYDESKKKDTASLTSELYKMSHNGYGAQVTTWNGTRSQLDKEAANERRQERKRTFDDQSEENCNKNKAKRQRLNNHHGYKSNPGYNAYQEIQNSRNKWHTNGFNNNNNNFYHLKNNNRRQRAFNHHRNNNRHKQRFRS